QADNLRQTLEDRKIIERAKGIIMDRGGVSEKDAFLRLRKLSNDRNEKLVDIARTIVTAEAAFATEAIAD
ncbi:MAG: ANTAR domain-containing protein, partial [Planctomycetaceae bacterium]|nr:ANTAR domain-containing protein [Planctomycetaceae bacterium]